MKHRGSASLGHFSRVADAHAIPYPIFPMKSLLALALSLSTATALLAAEPLKVLLITGGCCHDYVAQKDILKLGLEARAHVVVEHMHTPDKSTKPPLPLYGNPAYAKGYDLVIHDECSADIADPAVIAGVLQPHRDGIPGVNLHCAMHSYRFGNYKEPVAAGADNAAWFEYLGLQSTRHGPQEPIAIAYVEKSHPIAKGLADWTTIKEELYNNIELFTAKPLARGRQTVKEKDGTTKEVEAVVAWTNEFGPKKTRVFSTTIGHNNATVEDGRYLDLVTRGLLWAAGKLKDDGTPAAGYGPAGK
jgi:Trehalose utilisation